MAIGVLHVLIESYDYRISTLIAIGRRGSFGDFNRVIEIGTVVKSCAHNEGRPQNRTIALIYLGEGHLQAIVTFRTTGVRPGIIGSANHTAAGTVANQIQSGVHQIFSGRAYRDYDIIPGIRKRDIVPDSVPIRDTIRERHNGRAGTGSRIRTADNFRIFAEIVNRSRHAWSSTIFAFCPDH